MATPLFTYAISLIVGAGGVAGFAKKGSVASLIAGGGTGLALAVCGYEMQQGYVQQGNKHAVIVSSLLAAGMSLRAWRTRARMPMMVAGLGWCSVVVHHLAWREAFNASHAVSK